MAVQNRDTGVLDTLLELRDITDGAETSTAAETGVSFPVRKIGGYKAVMNVSAIDYTTTDETYSFQIQVSDVVGGTYTTIAELGTGVVLGSAGAARYELPLSGNLAAEIDADSAFIRVQATLAGTTPSITYGCHLEKMQRN